MKSASSGGYQPMGNKIIIHSSTSWQFVVPGISYETLRKRFVPIKCFQIQFIQGDIFALQLGGHIAFA
jgi:hypothetical protein